MENGADVNSLDYCDYTPLHIAAKAGSESNVAILLQHGADPNTTGARNKTPLHKARTLQIAKMLLEHGADPYRKMNKKGSETPTISVLDAFLHRHDQSFCDVLFDNCIRTNGQQLDSSALMLVYNLELFYQESQIMSKNRAPNEISVHSKMFTARRGKSLEHPIAETMLFLKKQRLFRYFWLGVFQYVMFLLCLTTMLAMQTVLLKQFDEKDLGLNGEGITIHDFCTGFEFDSFVVLGNGSFRLCFLWYDQDLRKHYFGDESWKCGLIFLNEWNTTKHFCNLDHKRVGFYGFYFFYSMTCLAVLSLAFKQVIKAWYNWRNFLNTMRDKLEIMVIMLTFTYLLGIFLFPRVVILHLSAWTIFIAWINMTILFGHFPKIGKYVSMFNDVFKEVMKFLVVYLPTLLAFAFSFYVLLPRSDGFDNPVTAILKVLSMMIGELDYESNFTTDISRESDYAIFSTQILYVFFLVMVSIITANLIIGMTVGKIAQLEKCARSLQLEESVIQVTTLLTTVPLADY